MTTTHDSNVCTHCAWTNPAPSTQCRGCGQPLTRIRDERDGIPTDVGSLPAAEGSGWIRGTISSAPQSVDMRVLNPFWLLVATVVVVFGQVLLHVVALPILLLLFLLTVMLHVMPAHRRGGPHLSSRLIGVGLVRSSARRASRGHAILGVRQGQHFRVTDGARTWTVQFPTDRPTDLLMGDRVRIQGRRRASGDFRAVRIVNERTGTTRRSQQSTSTVIAAVCAAALTLHFLT